MTKLYVLSVGSTPWVLNPEGASQADCERAIHWQESGQPTGATWRICEYYGADRDGKPVFISNGTEYVIPDRGIYTQEAWDRYCAQFTAAT